MNWQHTILSDNTDIDPIGFATGNGIYIALYIQKQSDNYAVNILYANDINSAKWSVKTLKTSHLPITCAGIEFTGTKFVIPYIINLSNALGALSFSSPEGDVEDHDNVLSFSHPIGLKSVRYINNKLIVCGLKQETDNANETSAVIWYCDNPEKWTEAKIVNFQTAQSYTCAIVYNEAKKQYTVYTVETQDGTNHHLIFSSTDLLQWTQGAEIASDALSTLPQPAFVYSKDYNALILFLHGDIYISKDGGSTFTKNKYPSGIGTETIRSAVCERAKIVASSGSDNQDDFKVLFSDGDPATKENWQVQVLNAKQQQGFDCKFANNQFIVLGGYGSAIEPCIYMAKYSANEFKTMQDRMPTHPGRVKLNPVSNNIYDLERADDPTQEGTKLNKANLLSDDAAVSVWNNTAPMRECTPSTALEHLGKGTYHVGDILTTIRDLSSDENWLECEGGQLSETDYPELYPLLPAGSGSGDWETNTFSIGKPNSGAPVDVATDGEWYVMISCNTSSSSQPNHWDVDAYCTRDPEGAWTRYSIKVDAPWTFGGNTGLNFIYANGYFAFIVTEYSTAGDGKSYIVYTQEPSKTWQTRLLNQTSATLGYCQSFKYLDNKFVAVFNSAVNSTYTCTILKFETINGTITEQKVFSNSNPSSIYDIDFYDGKWYAVYQVLSTSGETMNYETRLYYADTLEELYTNNQQVQIEQAQGTSSTYDYFYPQYLTCGNGYFVLWGTRNTNTVRNFKIYYNNNLFSSFANLELPQYAGLASVPKPIFFDGTFYVVLRDTSNNMPYLVYTSAPANWASKQLWGSPVARQCISVNKDASMLFAGALLQGYTTLTAAWKKAGKALPKITPGVGIHAYIRAKEGE